LVTRWELNDEVAISEGDGMFDNDFPPSEDEVAAAFAFGGVDVSPGRLAVNYEAYSSTLALIRKASPPGLGETVPASSFKAHWD
jgi:hypothetical protein